ncbi:MAG: DUF4065 domain-containing protein [Acidipropionibacterium sp.]|jgi:uncharacterized phage-associated protein|nr:DUF4065 domain-containing protein [Acidipropionibacterium sp.]
MTTAHEVADYIVSTGFRFTGEMQRQKLLYYIQAWSLAWDGAPVFDEDIEAWRDGPVVRSMRHVIPDGKNPANLSESQRATIDAVLTHYGNHGGKYLSGVTHGEKPWREAREGLRADEHGQQPISRTAMIREYSVQSLKGEGPRRRAVETSAAHDHSELLRRGARINKRWSRAMALLAK